MSGVRHSIEMSKFRHFLENVGIGFLSLRQQATAKGSPSELVRAAFAQFRAVSAEHLRTLGGRFSVPVLRLDRNSPDLWTPLI